MSRSDLRTKGAWIGLALLLAGTAFQIPSCQSLLTTVNPCGTIFSFCEPYELDALLGDVPDWELDPTCTVPYYGMYGDSPGTCGTDMVYPETPGPRPQGQP